MPKKQEKKTAKGRLDKFYHLAKQQGFRSRAAFKLVQLNKKYGFLESARCCIDLCAAPGGWLQVASKQMPPNSLIVGVDLVPIKPIPRCITFAEDINSFRCRDQLRTELKDWKADVVLHDGAPNVGTAWVQDAYAQSELVLQSMKLAVEFLAPGGTFVTKVFRSKDYNNLLWVFNQLFRKVEATKPPSSRNVSAEIFVVCQDFKAPKKIDPKFLDPRHVFKDLDPVADTALIQTTVDGKNSAKSIKIASNAVANVFEPEKKRRKREGYEDGETILFKAIGAKDFIEAADPISLLGTFNAIEFKRDEDKPFLDAAKTDDNIKACCEDLKVLGKKDFRNLLKWRKTWREDLGLELQGDHPSKEEQEEAKEKVQVTEMDDDEAIDQELERLTAEKDRRQRKERRKRNEARQKRVLKMQLQMTTPMDIGMDLQDEALHGGEEFFDLTQGGASKRIAAGEEAESDEEDDANAAGTIEEDLDSADEEERRAKELEAEMDGMYEQYQTKLSERDAKHRAREARKQNEHNDEWYGFTKEKDAADQDDDEESVEGGFELYNRRKEQEETYDTDDEEDDAYEREEREERIHAAKLARQERQLAADADDVSDADEQDSDLEDLVNTLESKADKTARQSREAAIWFDNPLFKDVAGIGEEDDEDDEEDDEEEEDDDEEEDESEVSEEASDVEMSEVNEDSTESPPTDAEDDDQWRFENEDQDAIKRRKIEQRGLTTAEAITLASQLVNREKSKEDLIDQGFSKHNFVDKSDLPQWFLDDEQKHYKPNIPPTKEAIAALAARQRALDARPIKKVAEAKARKKMRAMKQLESARKKAEGISDNVDISEREKAANIDKVLRKAGAKQKERKVQIVVAGGANKGKGRPRGVKGRYRMVDPRGKKEMRAKKRKDKAMGKKTTSSTNQKPRTPNGYSRRT